MDSLNIFSDDIYTKLQQAYKDKLTPDKPNTNLLTSIITTLQTSNFQLPTTLQNNVLHNLSHAKEILDIIYNPTPSKPQPLTNNNPFQLIHHLTTLSLTLTSHNIKSPYQTICLKSNQLILKTIHDISDYFINKHFKCFKYL